MIQARLFGGPQHDTFVELPSTLPAAPAVLTIAVWPSGVKLTKDSAKSFLPAVRTTDYLLTTVAYGVHYYVHRSLTGNPRDN